MTLSDTMKNVLLWIAAILFTLIFVVYQRATGPTYPERGKVSFNGQEISYKMLRSHEVNSDAPVTVQTRDTSVEGILRYKRYKTGDEWTAVAMERTDGKLIAYLPAQPAAGKLAYRVTLGRGQETVELTEQPVVIRFKGVVPAAVLIPHILLMFIAMLFSTRTGIEALTGGGQTYKFALITFFTLLAGGMIMGPVIQKLAFGDFWTGWPFGQDLTDNKTLVAFVFWLVAVIRLRKDPSRKGWAIAAAVVLVAVYLVPHSMFGSEFDYTAGEVITGKN